MNNEIIKRVMSLKVRKAIIESSIIFEQSEIKSNNEKLEKNGKSWNYYDYYLKLIEVSHLKIEELNFQIEEITMNISTLNKGLENGNQKRY